MGVVENIRKGILVTGSVLVMMLAGCGGSGDLSQKAATTSTETQSSMGSQQQAIAVFPKTVHHAKGETVIDKMPERIVVLYPWLTLDNLLALDIKPTAVTNAEGWFKTKTGLPSYLEERLQGVELLGPDQPLDVEKVLATEPDLIFGIHDMISDQYDKLNQIAPTIAFERPNVAACTAHCDWRSYHRNIASIFGKEEQAEKTIAEIERQMAEAKEKLAKSVGKDSVAILYIANDTMMLISDEKDSMVKLLYHELGLTPAMPIKDLKEMNDQLISLEGLAALNPDRILLYWTEKAELEKIEKSAVWQNLKAVKNKHVYFSDKTKEWNPYQPIGLRVLLDQLVELFAK
jgi:ABC-type Fe3+-hydroxamate transport system substrate-binding protein